MANFVQFDKDGNIISAGKTINIVNMVKYLPGSNTITDIDGNVLMDLAASAQNINTLQVQVATNTNDIATLYSTKADKSMFKIVTV